MPTYECTKDVKAGDQVRYRKGEKIETVAGSVHDQRLAESDDFKPVDAAAKEAVKAADGS